MHHSVGKVAHRMSSKCHIFCFVRIVTQSYFCIFFLIVSHLSVCDLNVINLVHGCRRRDRDLPTVYSKRKDHCTIYKSKMLTFEMFRL